MTYTRPGRWRRAPRDSASAARRGAPPPEAPRTTSRMRGVPPIMNRSFAAWFASWSMATVTKSENCSSTTGRIPVSAAPTPAPTKPHSEMGVSRTRPAPKRSYGPPSRGSSPTFPDVLAYDEDGLVGLRLLPEGLAHRLGERERSASGRRRNRVLGHVRCVDGGLHVGRVGVVCERSGDRRLDLGLDLSWTAAIPSASSSPSSASSLEAGSGSGLHSRTAPGRGRRVDWRASRAMRRNVPRSARGRRPGGRLRHGALPSPQPRGGRCRRSRRASRSRRRTAMSSTAPSRQPTTERANWLFSQTKTTGDPRSRRGSSPPGAAPWFAPRRRRRRRRLRSAQPRRTHPRRSEACAHVLSEDVDARGGDGGRGSWRRRRFADVIPPSCVQEIAACVRGFEVMADDEVVRQHRAHAGRRLPGRRRSAPCPGSARPGRARLRSSKRGCAASAVHRRGRGPVAVAAQRSRLGRNRHPMRVPCAGAACYESPPSAADLRSQGACMTPDDLAYTSTAELAFAYPRGTLAARGRRRFRRAHRGAEPEPDGVRVPGSRRRARAAPATPSGPRSQARSSACCTACRRRSRISSTSSPAGRRRSAGSGRSRD